MTSEFGAAAPADQAARLRALDPSRSFIVQAPAGSGKTGLLTQRFLAMLARVRHPEEIIAITFTRKAAAEMRSRIIDALRGPGKESPANDHEHRTRELANAAREWAREQGWDLLENPQRLRIQTIDSLCQFLSRRMPVTSGFGEMPPVAEDAVPLYRAAADSLLAELETQEPAADALAELLQSLDNDVESLTKLVAEMLERRDQWTRHIIVHGSREDMEHVLRKVVERQLTRAAETLPGDLRSRLRKLLVFAASNLPAEHLLAVFREATDWPAENAAQLPAWRAITELLLVRSGDWRKTVNRAQGFPPGKKAPEKGMKDDMLELLDELREHDALRHFLRGIRSLPDPVYRDSEWRLLEALFLVLRTALAHLRLVFSEQGRVDFIELSLSAQAALGEELEPTELALRFDYQLKHLLVDEFQDTSQNQYELFKRLTAGWEPGDGRTLFLVGDPMQSIYGFREAEVGLFLDAWEGRLGSVALEPLRLSVNFRSDRGVVEWVNEVFPQVLPERANKEKGAVTYVPATPCRPPGESSAARVYPYLARDDCTEARQVLEIVDGARRRGGTTAILARGKAHLSEIITHLRAAGIRYQAVELAELQHTPAVMDLVSLTLALLHPADRVSWLALLHGPLVGLSPADLVALCGEPSRQQERTIPDRLFDAERVARLSTVGQRQLARVIPVLDGVLADRGHRTLSHWIESAWLALGGPLTLVGDSAGEDLAVVFRLLRELDKGTRPVTPEAVQDALRSLCAGPDPLAGTELQLMTIHKAKGLEFDAVVVPGLGRRPRGDRPRLLYWLESSADRGIPELMFGPLRPSGMHDESATADYIRGLEAEKSALESGRLLYVAATRARRELHLLGHARPNAKGEPTPESGSLLAQLWPAIGAVWEKATATGASNLAEYEETESLAPAIRRQCVPADWTWPTPPSPIGRRQGEVENPGARIPFEWAGQTARAVGTVVHRLLQVCAEQGVPGEPGRWLRDRRGTFARMLQREGVVKVQLEEACGRVETALDNALRDPRGQWLLSREHSHAHSELPLTAVLGGRVRRMVVDRTFVDENGVRWVVDYKTGAHAGGDVESFLDQEAERYREQLTAYAATLRRLDDREVRAGLYFPLIEGGWRELECGSE